MIRLIDRYLGLRCLGIFILVLSVLLFIIIALDATGRIGEATRTEGGGLLLLELYALRIPEYVLTLATPALMISAIVCCVAMLRRGEFIALSASGMSPHAATRALFAVAALVVAGEWALSDQVVPMTAAIAERIEDKLEQQVRDGKCWKVQATQTAWFCAHQRIENGELSFSLIGIAPPSGGLVRADALRWQHGNWHLSGHLCRTWFDAAGREQLSYPDHLDLIGELALPYDPIGLKALLLPDTTLTGRQLLARGDGRDLSVFYGRFASGLAPLLALLVALPSFVRFLNRDRLIVATVSAMVKGAVPPILLSMAGAAGDGTGSPLLAAAIAVVAATLPGLYLYVRWRL